MLVQSKTIDEDGLRRLQKSQKMDFWNILGLEFGDYDQ